MASIKRKEADRRKSNESDSKESKPNPYHAPIDFRFVEGEMIDAEVARADRSIFQYNTTYRR